MGTGVFSGKPDVIQEGGGWGRSPRERERYFINHHCSHRLNYGIFTNTDDNKRENKKNFLHLIDMAKNKTVLQTLGFT